MGYFPFFIDIRDKRGVIIGGGKVAARKIEKLQPFEPILFVIAPEIIPRIQETERVFLKRRRFTEKDLEGAFFVIAASDDEEANARAAAYCREKGIFFNAADDKESCGFLFPALVKSGALTIGVSTEGASPGAAAAVKSKIAEQLPSRTEEILDYLAALRPLAKERIEDAYARASFLRETAVFCMEANRVLSEEETQERMQSYQNPHPKRIPGVVLAGAGCGAYDLITVRGLNALKRAEVVVYDALTDERLLEYAPESCEKIDVGKRCGKCCRTQEEINGLLIQEAKKGKRVVRLKGGDPFVFGRGGEEVLALKEQGIPVTEIPGITSAIAVPAAAGIPVTHRDISRSFHVITGHTKGKENSLPENFETLAALNGTLIFLMGLLHLPEITKKLLECGKDPDTPAAVVHGGFDGQFVSVRGTLSDIAKEAKQEEIEAPAVIIIGETAGFDFFSTTQ